MDKEVGAFRTISEVAEDLDLPQHVLRFWEMRFSQIRPMKRSGGRRYYRPEDVDLLRGIRRLLYGQGYTIKGVQRILKEQGVRAVASFGRGDGSEPPVLPPEREAEGDAQPADSSDGAMEEEPQSMAASLDPSQTRILRAAALEIEECLRILSAAKTADHTA